MTGDAQHATRCFLRRIYDVSFVSDLHTPILSDELPGRGGSTITEMRLDLALVKAVIKSVLVADHLVESINAIFSDDPEALYAVTCILSQTMRCSKGKAFASIEHVKTLSQDGLMEVRPQNPVEKKFTDWHDFGIEVLAQEFVERGWV
jgi:hypothetical protein